jgi:TetR/AcrR family transcriptional regulator, cholesterol catabolism regulator
VPVLRENMEGKERIITKAAELFMRYGIRTITMDEIATQLGISKKTLYQFFTDKDDMVNAAIDAIISKNEMDCMNFRDQAENEVHHVFLALESLEDMLKYTNQQMVYDLEKHYPQPYKKLREYKYQFLYKLMIENLQSGMRDGLYRPDIHVDIIAKARIESAFLAFNQDVFPHTRYNIAQVHFELAMFFLHGVATAKGKKLIEKYSNERNQKLSHEHKA